MSLTIEVTPIIDSGAIDTRIFDEAIIYEGSIDGEVLPPPPPACFLGAWYRKVVSSKDKWLGIEGIVKLGDFTPDETRFNLDGKGRYMDNPSVYMGGKSQKESDAGLNWNIMYEDDDTSQELTTATPKKGYRPFWRYIYSKAYEKDGNVEREEVNSWNVSHPKNFGHYYFPGDVLKMSVFSPIENYLQLKIKVITPTTIPKYVQIREKYHLKDNKPLDFASPLFYSYGHGKDDAEFKRVNSIDQYGNEGYNAKNTRATVSTCIWQDVYLYRKIDGKIMKVPFTEKRKSGNICPNELAVSVTCDEINNTESITLHPGKVMDVKGDK